MEGINSLEPLKIFFLNYLIIVNLKEIYIKCVIIKLVIYLLKLESFSKDNLDQLDFLNNQFKNISNKNGLIQPDNLLIDTPAHKKNMESVLILDTETTGLDENNNEVIEIGCILYNIPFKSILSQLSFLLPVEINDAEFINGISAEVSNVAQPWKQGMQFFLKLVESCDFIVAHNASFDKKWFGKGKLPYLEKKWICSLEDINWSFKKNIKSRPSVTDLALAFNIPVWNLHRALSDCYYISEIFKRIDSLEEILLKAIEPKYLYKAIVSYEDRILAKNAGFRWNSPVQGAWTRKLSETEATELDFKVEILN